MRVREIEDVIQDLTKLLISKLPTTRNDVLANWSTVNECARMIEFANHVLAEPRENEIQELRRWEQHGIIYACSTIIRRVADQYNVPNEVDK